MVKKMLVYRIQPQNAQLHAIRTETSAGDLANGVHVFDTISAVAACRGWIEERCVELATIKCEACDIRENDDYEGSLLIRGRGVIVSRIPFASTRDVADWADSQSD